MEAFYCESTSFLPTSDRMNTYRPKNMLSLLNICRHSKIFFTIRIPSFPSRDEFDAFTASCCFIVLYSHWISPLLPNLLRYVECEEDPAVRQKSDDSTRYQQGRRAGRFLILRVLSCQQIDSDIPRKSWKVFL